MNKEAVFLLDNNCHDLVINEPCESKDRIYVSDILKSYHQSIVNAISDEDIKKAFPTYVKTKRINSDEHYNFLDIDHNGKRYGAKWLKKELLKQ